MIDFHTHTLFSDGVLSPAEHVRRAFMLGYSVIGLTDHVDFSNLEFIYESILKFKDSMKNCGWDINIIPGIELTHVPVKKIATIVNKARGIGVPLIIMHGESPVEPVEKGTNLAAIDAGVDIVAHPGFISDEAVKLAVKNKVSLEISARKGHSLTNGYVAKIANKHGAKLVLDSDAHTPADFLTDAFKEKVALGCGMDEKQILSMEENIKEIAKKLNKNI